MAGGVNYTMQSGATAAWHDGVVANWETVTAARRAFQAWLATPAGRAQVARWDAGVPDADASTSPLVSRVDASVGVVQVVDSLVFPNNPSCPFPAA